MPVLNRLAVIKILPSLVSSPWLEKEVDYFGEDINFGYEPPPTDTNKFSHLVVEDMKVTSSTETT